MPPKSTRGAAASATPTPVDPKAASPIHSACARRADAHGDLSQAAVREVLREVGLMDLMENTGKRKGFRDAYLTTVAEKSGVPYSCGLARRGGARTDSYRGPRARPLHHLGAGGPRHGRRGRAHHSRGRDGRRNLGS